MDTDKALEIGKRFGLSLTDARTLSLLAKDEEHAEKIAAQFGDDNRAEVERLAESLSRETHL